jgi:hypothetical protein
VFIYHIPMCATCTLVMCSKHKTVQANTTGIFSTNLHYICNNQFWGQTQLGYFQLTYIIYITIISGENLYGLLSYCTDF